MCAVGFKIVLSECLQKGQNSFRRVNKLWCSSAAGCAILQQKAEVGKDNISIKAYPYPHPERKRESGTKANLLRKKCQGIKSTCAFAMSCELGDVPSEKEIPFSIATGIGTLFALAKQKKNQKHPSQRPYPRGWGRHRTGCFMPCFIYAKLCFN